MTERPLKLYEKLDPKLLKYVENSRDLVFADSALSRKYNQNGYLHVVDMIELAAGYRQINEVLRWPGF